MTLKLPDYSNTPGTMYILKYTSGKHKGEFKQLRVFNNDRSPKFDIDYHLLDGKMSLHKHIFIDGKRQKEHVPLSEHEMKKYHKILGGIVP